MKHKKSQHPLTDFDFCPIHGPHYKQRLSEVSALYLLGLVGTPELEAHPELAAYIERAQRQLKAEAEKEASHFRIHGD